MDFGDSLGFNSILVRLKVGTEMLGFAIAHCFNSILVRLKVAEQGLHVAYDARFQFHTGSIKSRCPRILLPL